MVNKNLISQFSISNATTHLINPVNHSLKPNKLKDMFDKLFEAQQKAGEVKKRLDAISVSGSAEGGKIIVNANANKVIQSITIDPDFFGEADKEELEELLIVAI